MPDNQSQNVDGYSDNTSTERTPTHGENPGVPGIPDPGRSEHAAPPLSPEEYARLKKEAEEENVDKTER